jgi:hypothetical protein
MSCDHSAFLAVSPPKKSSRTEIFQPRGFRSKGRAELPRSGAIPAFGRSWGRPGVALACRQCSPYARSNEIAGTRCSAAFSIKVNQPIRSQRLGLFPKWLVGASIVDRTSPRSIHTGDTPAPLADSGIGAVSAASAPRAGGPPVSSPNRQIGVPRPSTRPQAAERRHMTFDDSRPPPGAGPSDLRTDCHSRLPPRPDGLGYSLPGLRPFRSRLAVASTRRSP